MGPLCPVCDRPGEVEGGRWSCAPCGLALEHRGPSFLAAPGAHAADYPADGSDTIAAIEDVSFWFSHRNRVLIAALERFPPGGRLWDIGGGNGFQARAFERAGYPCVVVEPGPRGAERARDRGVSCVIHARLEDLALPSGRVAAASALDVVEHLAAPEALFGEIRRVLRPGGRLYVTVPASPLLWSEEDDYAEHKRRYTVTTLRRALDDAGFRVEHLTPYFEPLWLPVLMVRALPFRARGALGLPPSTKRASEHVPRGASARVLDVLLAREARAIQAGRVLPIGTSLLAIANKPG